MGGYQLRLGQFPYDIDDKPAVVRIQRRCGLIHQYHLRLHGKNGGDGRHPLLTARKLMIMPVLQFGKSETPQHFIHLFLRFLTAHHVIQRSEHHILIYGGHKHLVVRILKDKPCHFSYLRQILLPDLHPARKNPARSGKKPEGKLHDGRLPGTVFTDKPDGLSLPNPERNILQNLFSRFIRKTHVFIFQHLFHLTRRFPRSLAAGTKRSIRKKRTLMHSQSASDMRKGCSGA